MLTVKVCLFEIPMRFTLAFEFCCIFGRCIVEGERLDGIIGIFYPISGVLEPATSASCSPSSRQFMASFCVLS